MITSICEKYWHFVLVQGVLGGISNGFLMFPSMAATPQYFNKKRGAAMGLAIAGSSVGAIVFPVVLSRLLKDIGFGWAVRTCGFIMIPLLIFSSIVVKARLPPRESKFVLWSAFRMPLFDLSIAALFFLFLGMFVPLFYIPAYAISHGVSSQLAFYLVAVVNGASIPGRIIPGILGDKFGKLNTLLFAGTFTSLIIYCWTKATTEAEIIGFSIAFGFTSGAIISAGSVVFTICPKSPKDIGTFMGMGIAVASFAVLIGPPINGALLNRYGSFAELSFFSGSMCAAGALFTVLAKTQTREGISGLV
jgi:MFS family permease